MNKTGNYIITALFSLLIGFFFVNQLHPIIPDAEYNENKKKAEKPDFDIRNLDSYPRKFELYLSDNFNLRGTFLKHMSIINSVVWNKSPKPDVIIIGKDKWLYNVDKDLDCYYGKRNFSKQQLEDVLNEFQYRKSILDSMGIQMALVIHPSKYSIYPEYLPSYLISQNTIGSATQLCDYFKKNSNINIIYTKEYLMPLKDRHQLYHKNDSHWNDLAGYYVSKAMLAQISDKIPEIPLDRFCPDTIKNRKANLAHMTGNADAYAETAVMLSLCEHDAQPYERFTYTPLENFPYKSEYQLGFKSENDSLPDALIIRDSFANALIPYLRNSFHYSTYIWDGWNYGFNLEIIEKEKPDLVIYMVLESLIPNIHSRGLTQNIK